MRDGSLHHVAICTLTLPFTPIPTYSVSHRSVGLISFPFAVCVLESGEIVWKRKRDGEGSRLQSLSGRASLILSSVIQFPILSSVITVRKGIGEEMVRSQLGLFWASEELSPKRLGGSLTRVKSGNHSRS